MPSASRFAVALGMAVSATASAQTPVDPRQAQRPSGKGDVEIQLTFVPSSLRQFVENSTLIVDAAVEAVLPATNRRPNARTPDIETRARFAVREVLKGSVPAPDGRILVAQEGGKWDTWDLTVDGDRLAVANERYILFLAQEDPRLAPDALQARVFRPVAVWMGKFRVVDDRVSLPPQLESRMPQYHGMRADQLLAELRDVVAGRTPPPTPAGRVPLPGGPGLRVEKGTVNPGAQKP
jgi:hypothetical protein